ncbi:MAG TPA: response regulator transcription factor [Phycisphaerales bacterium]|nr:response regulator transcription factor [Phycisphaerales bacterium]
MEQQPVVFVVDDDPAVRTGIKFLVSSVDLQFAEFSSAREFLDSYDPSRPGCLILDIRMPKMGGLELQDELNKLDFILPIIFLTGHGDVPVSVKALKAGAFDFIEKPPQDQVLLDTIQKALRKDAQDRETMQHKQQLKAKLSLLSDKDVEVLKMIADSQPNKTIAFKMGLSEKTIEYHRAKIMKKLEVPSIQELVKFALEAGML